MQNQSAYLSLRDITKTYPGVTALDDVSVDFKKGEVHALVGENGAGKSTLIKVLSGAIRPDGGEIILDGKKYSHMTPTDSRGLGIEVIYQEFNLMPTLSVAENVFLGDMVGGKITINMREMEKRTQQLFDSLKIGISPRAIVRDLSVAYMQLVEIVKAISKDVKILVMDEPTAPLTTSEVEILFGLIQRLKERGVTIIYISHRLNEIFQVADRVTVLRDGHKISTRDIGEVTRDQMIFDMVGREVSETFPERENPIGDVVLSVKNLSGNGVSGINFAVHAGEILGLAGLVGAGRTEMVRLLYGADKREGGEVRLMGKEIHPRNPREAMDEGILLIPEDRKRQGVILNLSISDNVALPIVKSISKMTVINKKREREIVAEQQRDLSIRTPSLSQLVKNLSGGNQQKVVLAKTLACHGKVLIFDEPTRGIDVGAKHEVYLLMKKLCEKGMAIIMISSEMEEIIGMSDRILVLSEGEATGMLERSEVTQEKILQLASGHN